MESLEYLNHTFAVTHFATAAAKLLQSCPTLCDPTDSSPLGSPIPGILQARTLERVAISFSSNPLYPHTNFGIMILFSVC